MSAITYSDMIILSTFMSMSINQDVQVLYKTMPSLGGLWSPPFLLAMSHSATSATAWSFIFKCVSFSGGYTPPYDISCWPLGRNNCKYTKTGRWILGAEQMEYITTPYIYLPQNMLFMRINMMGWGGKYLTHRHSASNGNIFQSSPEGINCFLDKLFHTRL